MANNKKKIIINKGNNEPIKYIWWRERANYKHTGRGLWRRPCW